MKVSSMLGLILCMGLTGLGISAQTRSASVQVGDGSPAGSPLLVTGKVLFEEQLSADRVVGRYTVDAVFTNVSPKPILCYQVAFDLSPENGGGTHSIYNDDRFFGEEIQPGSQYELQEKPRPWEITPSNPKLLPGTARAQARVVFVEFSDGSRFGSSTWGDHLTTERGNATATLNSLLKAYEGGGSGPLAQNLQDAIKNPTEPYGSITSVVVNHIETVLDTKGSGAAVAEIQRYLNNANLRKQAM
jgi:hypothetical protein